MVNGPQRLASYLRRQKISLRELARRAGVSPASICRARRGNGLGLVVALALAKATGGEVPVEAWGK